MSTIKKLKEVGQCALAAGIILGSPITTTAYIAYVFLSGKITWKELMSDGGGTSEPPKRSKRKRKSATTRRRTRRRLSSQNVSLKQGKE